MNNANILNHKTIGEKIVNTDKRFFAYYVNSYFAHDLLFLLILVLEATSSEINPEP